MMPRVEMTGESRVINPGAAGQEAERRVIECDDRGGPVGADMNLSHGVRPSRGENGPGVPFLTEG